MSEDDVLFGYRLQLVDLAGRVGVARHVVPSASTARLTTSGSAGASATAWRSAPEGAAPAPDAQPALAARRADDRPPSHSATRPGTEANRGRAQEAALECAPRVPQR